MTALNQTAATLASIKTTWRLGVHVPSFWRDTNHTPASENKTNLMRAYLRRHACGATAKELAIDADLESTALVGALLKQDIRKGAIQYHDGAYYLNTAYDQLLATQLAQAATLLKKHGYTVEAP